MMATIATLVPINSGEPMVLPELRPVGRAALMLAKEGIQVIFGDTVADGRVTGMVAEGGGWRRVEAVSVMGFHDRYPSQRRAEKYRAICREQAGRPMSNPQSITLLCRDKLRCQEWLDTFGVRQPPVEADSAMFRKRLTDWGLAFLKPRFGALGTSVNRVAPTDDLPVFLPSVVPGQEDPAILQRAVSPPLGWAGRSVRVLCQRMPDHSWYQCPAVLRQSRTDPVVNAARGAAVMPAADGLSVDTMEQISHACVRVCSAITAADGGRWAVELGVDLVIDSDGVPWVIEVNSRPRGRLEVLAALDGERFADAHVQACARPIRTMAHLLRTEAVSDVRGGVKCR